MRTIYFDWTSGETLYAKKSPLDISVWANDVIAFVEIGTTGQYEAEVPTDHHVIYLQAGGSPVDTDVSVGYEPEVIIPAKILGF